MLQVRVATFNIRHGRAFDGRNSWPIRFRAVAQVIDELDADCIGLQEVFAFQLRSLRRHVRKNTFTAETARTNTWWGERNPIGLSSKVVVKSVKTYWFGGQAGKR